MPQKGMRYSVKNAYTYAKNAQKGSFSSAKQEKKRTVIAVLFFDWIKLRFRWSRGSPRNSPDLR